ncbi:MAG: glutamate--tRNA ligase [Actinomycetes bacterium]|jgi:glutamyl-tRNA synthetase|nr:MAG: glutamate--tRNA ligase [Actinomycetota bacterium]
MTVRVRMAPSPTGVLHVGTARAALFNWLYARHNDGVFVVRIDDTDLERSTKEYEEEILDAITWLGLDWDEGPRVGGPHGTYRQSDRFDRYREVAHQLVESGHAYFDDRSSEELDELRQRAVAEGKNPAHYIRRPERERTEGAIRLSIPQDAPIVFDDLVRGTVSFEPEDVDDFVILRSDGTPTYHLASTVDDVDYEITHVARGEDILPSTPKHIVLTRAMSFTEPVYAHLPLLFGTDGKKLSKRHGATALSEYREAGFLPEAIFNYLANLGWSLDGETTIFTREQAIAAFDLADVSRHPATFDPEKLTWMNGEYIRAMDTARFEETVRPWIEKGLGREVTDEEWERFRHVSALVQERTRLLPEAAEITRFLFVDIDAYDPQAWEKVMTKDGVATVLDRVLEALDSVGSWDHAAIEEELRKLPEQLGMGASKVFQPVRVAVTGTSVSPPLFESMAALGREKTLERIRRARGELG